MSRWYSNENEEERKKMYAQLTEWILAGKFRAPPIERIPLTDAINALETAQTKFEKKIILV